MDENSSNGDMEAQLVSMYKEREILERELGVSSAALIIALVRSMEEQLISLYREKEESWSSGSSQSRSSSGTR